MNPHAMNPHGAVGFWEPHISYHIGLPNPHLGWEDFTTISVEVCDMTSSHETGIELIYCLNTEADNFRFCVLHLATRAR